MWKHPSGCGCNEMEKNECWYAKQHGKVCAVSSQQRVPSLQPSRGDISPSLPLAPPPTPDLNSLSVKITSRCSTRFPCCRAMQWSVRVHIWKWWWHTPVIPVFGDWDRKITSLKPPGLYNEGPRTDSLPQWYRVLYVLKVLAFVPNMGEKEEKNRLRGGKRLD